MKTKIKIPLLLILVIISFITLIKLTNRPETSKRDRYEKYLNSLSKDFDRKKTSEIPKADFPELAALQEFIMTMDPATKQIPKERLIEAFEQLNHNTKTISRNSSKISWQELKANMGGRTRCVAFDPNDNTHKKVWAGSVSGGLWYNNDITDSNSAWNTSFHFTPTPTVSCIAFDKKDEKIMYIGTGEAQTARTTYRESSARGYGIWTSPDNGKTWSLLSSTKNFMYVNDIETRIENDTSVIYAAVVSGTYKGQDHASLPSDGLFRSKDMGNSWEQVLPDIKGKSKPYAPADIEISADGRIFVGSMKNLDGDGGSTILWSDTGTKNTWTIYDAYQTKIINGADYTVPGRVKIASSPSNPKVVYGIFGAGLYSTEGFNYSYGKYIIKSDNGGTSWSEKYNDPEVDDRNWASLSWHALAAQVSPSNPDELYVAGLDLYRLTGTQMTRLSDWVGMYYPGRSDYVHADIHCIEFMPGSSSKMVISTDGGIFYTGTASLTQPLFEEHNKNYNTLQFYSCDIHPTADSNYFIGGLQDNGTLLYTPYKTPDMRQMISGGDGAYCFFDKISPTIYITSYYYNRYYLFFNHNIYKQIGQYSGIFINPADYDSEQKSLFANAVTFANGNPRSILRIKDVLSSASEIVQLNTQSNVAFSHVKISPYSSNGQTTLFLGTQSGLLYEVSDALSSTPSVKEIGSSSFPVANISCVAVGGSNDSLLVTFSNYGVSSVWLTYDGGQSWKEIENGLPDIPVRWAVFHPKHSRQAMLATELGIWEGINLDDSSFTWEKADQGMNAVRVDMLKVREADQKVLAATHGRGLYLASWPFNQGFEAKFIANHQSIEKGDSVDFTNLSSGHENSYWLFEGGSPANSSQENPKGILYDSTGSFDVLLVVENSEGDKDSLLKKNYINVLSSGIEQNSVEAPIIYPNPSSGLIKLSLGNHFTINEVMIFNDMGRQIKHYKNPEKNNFLQLDLSSYNRGLYFAELKTSNKSFIVKFILN